MRRRTRTWRPRQTSKVRCNYCIHDLGVAAHPMNNYMGVFNLKLETERDCTLGEAIVREQPRDDDDTTQRQMRHLSTFDKHQVMMLGHRGIDLRARGAT